MGRCPSKGYGAYDEVGGDLDFGDPEDETTTLPSTSCECDSIGKKTGKPGCKRHNQNPIHWCYVSIGCDMDKWLAENGPNFYSGESTKFGMKWRQCTPEQAATEPPKTVAWCNMIELQGRYKRGNGVCDSRLNIDVCEWDGGDCCDKNGASPNLELCVEDVCE